MGLMLSSLTQTGAAPPTTGTVNGMPVPKVRLAQGNVTGEVFDPAINGPGATVTVWQAPEIVAINIDPVLLDPALDLRVELLRWRRGRAGAARRPAAWTHPSHWVGGVANSGSDTHGGMHYANVTPTVATPLGIDRPTEAPITARNDVINTGRWLPPWFEFEQLRFRDADQPTASPGALLGGPLQLPVPTGTGQQGLTPGVRAAYSKRYTNLKIAFRYSTIGPDGRGRVTGPVSKTIIVGTRYHAFVTDHGVSAAYGAVHARVHPLFNSLDWKCWFDERHPAGN